MAWVNDEDQGLALNLKIILDDNEREAQNSKESFE